MPWGRRKREVALAGGLIAVAAVVLVLVLSGGEDDSVEDALAYLPRDAAAVVSVETDLGDAQWDAFAATAGRELFAQISGAEEAEGPDLLDLARGRRVETMVTALLASEGINYDGDVKPALGGELVLGTVDLPGSVEDLGEADEVVAVLDAGDEDDAERLLGVMELEPVGSYRDAKLWSDEGLEPDEPSDESATVATDDGVIVVATDSEALEPAIDRAREGEHLTEEDFEAGLAEIEGDKLVSGYVNPERWLELPELQPLAGLPWVAALRSIGFGVSFGSDSAEAEVVAATDPAGLSEADLPFPPEGGEPALVRLPNEVASASIDQSFTTVFLMQAARALFADSDFVRDVDAIQADLGIDFEQEVLRQFAGPSASSVTLDGRFAARSTVADPEAMRALLPRLAPRLPQLVRDLDSLGNEGLLALLFIAPDAPVATVPTDAESVEPAPGGAPNEHLYVIEGPQGPRGLDPVIELPQRIVFGMIGDTFVVASDRERARAIAAAEAAPVDGLEGASVLSGDHVRDTDDAIESATGLALTEASGFEASIRAALDAVRAELTVSYDD